MSWETGFQQGPQPGAGAQGTRMGVPHGSQMPGPPQMHGIRIQGPAHGTAMQGPPHGATIQNPPNNSNIYIDWAQKQGNGIGVSGHQRGPGNLPSPPPLTPGYRPPMPAHTANTGQPPSYRVTQAPDFRQGTGSQAPDFRQGTGPCNITTATAVHHPPQPGTGSSYAPGRGIGGGHMSGMGSVAGFTSAPGGTTPQVSGTRPGYTGSQQQGRRSDLYNIQQPGYPDQQPGHPGHQPGYPGPQQQPSGRMNFPGGQPGPVVPGGRGNGYMGQPRPAHMQQPSAVPANTPRQLTPPPYSYRPPGQPGQTYPAQTHRAPGDAGQNIGPPRQPSHMTPQHSTVISNSMQEEAAQRAHIQQMAEHLARTRSPGHPVTSVPGQTVTSDQRAARIQQMAEELARKCSDNGKDPAVLVESLRRSAQQRMNPQAPNVSQPTFRPPAPNVPPDVMSFVLGSNRGGTIPQSSGRTAEMQSQQNVPGRRPPPAHQQPQNAPRFPSPAHQQTQRTPPFRPISPVGSRTGSSNVGEPSRDRTVVNQIRTAFVLPSTSPVKEPHDKGMLGRWYAQPSTETRRITTGHVEQVNKVLPPNTLNEPRNVQMGVPDNRLPVIPSSNAQTSAADRPVIGSPQVGSPQVGSPQVGSPQVASLHPEVPNREPDDRRIFNPQPDKPSSTSSSHGTPNKQPNGRSPPIIQPEVQSKMPTSSSPADVPDREPDDRFLFTSTPANSQESSSNVHSLISPADTAKTGDGVNQAETNDKGGHADATETEDASVLDSIDMMEVICRRRIDKELTLDMAGLGGETYLTPEMGTIEQTSDKVYSPSMGTDLDSGPTGYSQDVHVGIENVEGGEVYGQDATLIQPTVVGTEPENAQLETHRGIPAVNTADQPQRKRKTSGQATTKNPEKPSTTGKGKSADSEERSDGQTTSSESTVSAMSGSSNVSRKRKTRDDDVTVEDDTNEEEPAPKKKKVARSRGKKPGAARGRRKVFTRDDDVSEDDEASDYEPASKKRKGPGSRGGRGRGRGRGRGGRYAGYTNGGARPDVTPPSTRGTKNTRGGSGAARARRGRGKSSEGATINTVPISNPQELMTFLGDCSPEVLAEGTLSFNTLKDICELFQNQAGGLSSQADSVTSDDEINTPAVKQENIDEDTSAAMDTGNDVDEAAVDDGRLVNATAVDDVSSRDDVSSTDTYEVVSLGGSNMKMKIALKNNTLNQEDAGKNGSSCRKEKNIIDEEPEVASSQGIENNECATGETVNSDVSDSTDHPVAGPSRIDNPNAQINDRVTVCTDSERVTETTNHPVAGPSCTDSPSVQVNDRVMYCTDTEKVTLVKFHGTVVLRLETPEGKFYVMKELAQTAFKFEKNKSVKIRALYAIKDQCLGLPFKAIDQSLKPFVLRNLKSRCNLKVGNKIGIISESNALKLFHDLYKKKHCPNCPVGCIIERLGDETNHEQESVTDRDQNNEQDPVTDRRSDRNGSPRESERNIFKAFELESEGMGVSGVGIEDDGYDTDSTLPYVDGKPMERLNDFHDSNTNEESIRREGELTNDSHLESNNGNVGSYIKVHSKVTFDETCDDTVTTDANPADRPKDTVIQSSNTEPDSHSTNVQPGVNAGGIIIIDDTQEMDVSCTEHDDQKACDTDFEIVCKTSPVCDEIVAPKETSTDTKSVSDVNLPNIYEDISDDDNGGNEIEKKDELRDSDPKSNISSTEQDGDECPSQTSVIVIDDVDNGTEASSDTTPSDSSDSDDVVIIGIDVKPETDAGEDASERKVEFSKHLNHDNVVDITQNLIKKIRILSDIKRLEIGPKLNDEMNKKVVDLTLSDDEEEDGTNVGRKRDRSYSGKENLPAGKHQDGNVSDTPEPAKDHHLVSTKDKFLVEAEQQLKDCIERANNAKDDTVLKSVYNSLMDTEFPLCKWSQSFLDNYEQEIIMEAQRVRSLETLSLVGDSLPVEKDSIKIPRNPNCSERQEEDMAEDNGHCI